MIALKPGDPVIYCPLASTGHYRAEVFAVRMDGSADIELRKDDTGFGDPVRLTHIVVVEALTQLIPGTCTRAI